MTTENKFFLIAVVHTPVGQFRGRMNRTPGTYADVVEARNSIQESLEHLKTLTLFGTSSAADETETTLSTNVIQSSVFLFDIFAEAAVFPLYPEIPQAD